MLFANAVVHPRPKISLQTSGRNGAHLFAINSRTIIEVRCVTAHVSGAIAVIARSVIGFRTTQPKRTCN